MLVTYLSRVEYTFGKSKLNFSAHQSSFLFLHSELVSKYLKNCNLFHLSFPIKQRFLMTAVSCSYLLHMYNTKYNQTSTGVCEGGGGHFYTGGCQIRFFFSEVHSMTPRAGSRAAIICVSSSDGNGAWLLRDIHYFSNDHISPPLSTVWLQPSSLLLVDPTYSPPI